MKLNTDDLLKRIAYLEQLGQTALATETQDQFSHYIKSPPFHGYRSSTLSFLKGTFGEAHPFYVEFDEKTSSAGYYELLSGIEILKAIKAEIQNGWFQTYKGLISTEIFSDFLEMASHLLDNNYKDASAVMIGSVLEEQLRQLCVNNAIEISLDKDGDIFPKKADRLNSDLAGKEVYNKLDQKNVTAWLDLRNKAAHGKYNEYAIEQVKIMYSGVSDFITRHQI